MIVVGYNGFTRGAELFAGLYGATGRDRHSILGHDAAVALMIDGELVVAVEEERLNREKKTSDFPIESLRYCLDQAGVAIDQVDRFAFPWSFPSSTVTTMINAIAATELPDAAKFDRLRRFGDLHTGILSHQAIRADLAARTGFDVPAEKIVTVPHHLAHLSCGRHFSDGGDAAFLISDGRAEMCSAIAGEIRDGEITVFDDMTITVTHSLALLYGEITRYLGFMPNNDEYKVMGLSAFADTEQPNPLIEHEVVQLLPNGRYALAIPNDPAGTRGYYALLDRIFGGSEDVREEPSYQARVARAAQDMVEVVTAHQVAELERRTTAPQLLIEGGLALNCVNNTKLLENSRFADAHVSFGASDPGVAIGAAVYAGGTTTRDPSPYLGPHYSDDEVETVLRQYTDRVRWVVMDDIAGETAKLLTEKTVIGWFHGRTEYGPRALGNRSILANPSFPDIKDIINTRVKHREPFRPFAPIVLEDDAAKVFELGKKKSSPYMTFVFPVRPEYVSVIPGAVHVDGTSRIQTVTEEGNPLLAELLGRFTELTGIPCLVNTSFNVAGEPIVCSPRDAVECFLNTEIDHLVLGRFLVSKQD